MKEPRTAISPGLNVNVAAPPVGSSAMTKRILEQAAEATLSQIKIDSDLRNDETAGIDARREAPAGVWLEVPATLAELRG
jgi:hypothetical protein